MADFESTVWDDERIYMVDFGRAPSRSHPRKSRPDIDRIGYYDDAFPGEHGPIVSCRVGQGNVRVRFYRTEISTSARLYAVPADRTIVRMRSPRNGRLPGRVATTLSFVALRAGRTSIDIRYHWPDGPIIGRLYVDARATRNVNVRVHIVSSGGNGPTTPFMGANQSPGTALAAFHQSTITDLFRDTNHVLEPHGIRIRVREVVNTNWTNAMFGAAALGATGRIMRAMAFAPQRSRNRLNVYLFDGSTLPFNVTWVALGPPAAWAVATGRRWPNNATGRTGSGIAVNTQFNITGQIMAHEFGHTFSLDRILTAGANSGSALQWHSIGDQANAAGTGHGRASRDDSVSRRRLMYPFITLAGSSNAWRRDVGYGNDMGALLIQRRLNRDITMEESRRAYNFIGTRANIYRR